MKQNMNSTDTTARTGAAPKAFSSTNGYEKFRNSIIKFFLLLALVISFAPGYSRAHHVSSIAYVLQEVGKKKIGEWEVVLRVMPPRFTSDENPPKSLEKTHVLLAGFTHRFEMKIQGGKSGGALPGKLDVKLTFTQNEWTKSVTLRKFHEDKSKIYGANLKLGERGPYAITATISGLSSQPVQGRFSFDFDHESVKDVMQDLEKILGKLGQETLTLGLDGRLIPPRKEQRVRRLAERFQYFVPWISHLREGEAQDLYDDLTRKLLALSKQMSRNTQKPDYDRLAENLAAARTLCSQCHHIFQEADSTGKPVRLPGAATR